MASIVPDHRWQVHLCPECFTPVMRVCEDCGKEQKLRVTDELGYCLGCASYLERTIPPSSNTGVTFSTGGE